MKKIILITILLLGNSIFGQEDPYELPQVVPSSPTVAALGSYSYLPVGLATGTPNISIPIWQTKGNSLSLPISLSYRPGVKIEESSPYTGHGWSLFAGGVITRIVKDKADPWPRRNDLDQQLSYPEIASIADGTYDGAPDIFNYNFNGYTGQFALKRDFKSLYYLDEQRNWKFSWNSSDMIEIITEDGTKYIFSDTETTTFEGNSGGSANDIITSWFLTSIISAKADEKIVLSYVPDNPSMPRRANNTLEINPYTRVERFIPESPDVFPFNTKKVSSIVHYINNVAVNTVNFEASTLREDTIGSSSSYALSRISIFDGDDNGQPIKYFDFNIRNVQGERLFLYGIQEYSGDGLLSKPPYEFTYINENQLPGRLEYKADHWGYYSNNGTEFPYIEGLKWRSGKTKKPSIHATYGSLRSMKFPTGAQTIFAYELNEYHEEDWDYDTHLLSLKWDNGNNHWEKPNNGAASNLETHSFTTQTDQYVKVHFCLQLEKESNNTSDLIGQLNNTEIYIRNTATGEDMFSVRFDAEGDPEEVDMLVYSNDQRVISPRDQRCLGKIPNGPGFDCGSLVNAGQVVPAGYANTNAYAYRSYSFNENIFGECLDRELFVLLPPGNYTAAVKTANSGRLGNSSSAILELTHHNGNRVNNKIKAGGIRVRNQYLTGTDFEEEIRSYNYEIHDNNGNSLRKSSGTITDRPLPGLFVERYNGSPYPWRFDDLYIVNSKPRHIENSTIYYTEVKVTDGEEDENGFEIHKFHGVDAINNYNVVFDSQHNGVLNPLGVSPQFRMPFKYWERYPYSLTLIENGLWGKPISTSYFKNENGNHTLLSKDTFEYDRRSQPLLYTAEADINSSPSGSGSAMLVRSHLTFKYSLLKSTENIQYDVNGQNPISTKTTYNYASQHFMPNKITTSDSQGITQVKKIKYSFEYENADFRRNSSINTDHLFDANILVPIEEQLWKLEAGIPKLIEGKLNIYDKVSSPSNPNEIYKPIEILGLEVSAISNQAGTAIANEFNERYYSDNLNWYNGISGYDYGLNGIDLEYDQAGNLITGTPKNGPSVYYVWGYHGQYPIAKFENFNSSQIDTEMQNLINAAVLASNNDDSISNENILRTALTNLGSTPALSSAMVTTYTYNPSIGITSTTDPRGYTMTYHYDKLNRLQFVKDEDGNLISENKYNYKNQQ